MRWRAIDWAMHSFIWGDDPVGGPGGEHVENLALTSGEHHQGIAMVAVVEEQNPVASCQPLRFRLCCPGTEVACCLPRVEHEDSPYGRALARAVRHRPVEGS